MQSHGFSRPAAGWRPPRGKPSEGLPEALLCPASTVSPRRMGGAEKPCPFPPRATFDSLRRRGCRCPGGCWNGDCCAWDRGENIVALKGVVGYFFQYSSRVESRKSVQWAAAGRGKSCWPSRPSGKGRRADRRRPAHAVVDSFINTLWESVNHGWILAITRPQGRL